eukprot:2018612-Amphidinium_carterae.2
MGLSSKGTEKGRAPAITKLAVIGAASCAVGTRRLQFSVLLTLHPHDRFKAVAVCGVSGQFKGQKEVMYNTIVAWRLCAAQCAASSQCRTAWFCVALAS